MIATKLIAGDIQLNDNLEFVEATERQMIIQDKENKIKLSKGSHKPRFSLGHPWDEYLTTRLSDGAVINSILTELRSDEDLITEKTKINTVYQGTKTIFNIEMYLNEEAIERIKDNEGVKIEVVING